MMTNEWSMNFATAIPFVKRPIAPNGYGTFTTFGRPTNNSHLDSTFQMLQTTYACLRHKCIQLQ